MPNAKTKAEKLERRIVNEMKSGEHRQMAREARRTVHSALKWGRA